MLVFSYKNNYSICPVTCDTLGLEEVVAGMLGTRDVKCSSQVGQIMSMTHLGNESASDGKELQP